jgi:hypothetical protein
VAEGSSHVEAWEQTTITRKSRNANTNLHGNALLQDASEDLKFTTLKDWFAWWDVKPIKGKLRMYKAVRPDGLDFYAGTVRYEVGNIVECSDWRENYDEECGRALHCCPHLFLTDGYARGDHIHVAVEVAVRDMRLPKAMSMPDKIRVKKLKVLEIVKGDSQ